MLGEAIPKLRLYTAQGQRAGSTGGARLISKEASGVGLPNVFNTGRSGMVAAKAAIATTGHNIANSNTEGYSRQRVQTEAAVAAATAMAASIVGSGTQGLARRARERRIHRKADPQRRPRHGQPRREGHGPPPDRGHFQRDERRRPQPSGLALLQRVPKALQRARERSRPRSPCARRRRRWSTISTGCAREVDEVQKHIDSRIEGYTREANAARRHRARAQRADSTSRKRPARPQRSRGQARPGAEKARVLRRHVHAQGQARQLQRRHQRNRARSSSARRPRRSPSSAARPTIRASRRTRSISRPRRARSRTSRIGSRAASSARFSKSRDQTAFDGLGPPRRAGLHAHPRRSTKSTGRASPATGSRAWLFSSRSIRKIAQPSSSTYRTRSRPA